MLLSAVLLLVRVASALIVDQPGYTDAYYYHDVARRLAAGQGLTADFVWNPLEAAPGTALPIPSHRFWMPLASLIQAAGIVLLPFLDSFHASQWLTIVCAMGIPLVAYAAARSLGSGEPAALVTAALAGLGGAFAPGWVSLDAFAPAAVIGTLFFLTFARAARGDATAGALAGILVGLLFLARGEGALFGLALVALLPHPATRRAGLFATGTALAIGLGWLMRDLLPGLPAGLFARTALLVRYEEFFAVAPPDGGAVLVDVPAFLGAKATALAANLATAAIGFLVILVPFIATGGLARARRPAVRAFFGLLLIVYLAESLIWTLHSTRGSYFHSLAAFFPYGIALGVLGAAATLERRRWHRRAVTLVSASGLAGAALVSAMAVGQWGASFDPPYRARLAALERIPPGAFLAVDAAAWRWISGRTVVVTPADGIAAASCYRSAIDLRSIVLEPAHFSAYDDLYRRLALSAGSANEPIRVQALGDARDCPQ